MSRRHRAAYSAGSELARCVLPLGTTLLAWQCAVWVVPANTYLKGPLAAIAFLARGNNISGVLNALGNTIWFVLLGYAVGIGCSVTLACSFVLWDGLETALAPFIVLIGTVPIIVVTPLLTLTLGRGVGVGIAVCAIVTFFPGLVNVRAGLSQTDAASMQAMQALGAGRWKVLYKLRMPTAVPSVLTSCKLALPGALGGVLLVEIIATGQGIGQYITSARALLNYDEMWAGIVAVLVTAVVLYAVLATAETVLIGYFAPERATRRKLLV